MKPLKNSVVTAIEASDREIFAAIRKRCREPAARHRERKDLFEDYIRRQAQENEVLEKRVTCSTRVIARHRGSVP